MVDETALAVPPPVPAEQTLKRPAESLGDSPMKDPQLEKRVKVDESASPVDSVQPVPVSTAVSETEQTIVNATPEVKDENAMEVVEQESAKPVAETEPVQESVSNMLTAVQPTAEPSPEITEQTSVAPNHDSADDGEFSRDVSQDISMMSLPDVNQSFSAPADGSVSLFNDIYMKLLTNLGYWSGG